LLYLAESRASSGAPAPQALLRACAMQFLFRALAGTDNAPLRSQIEKQLLRLIGDFVPSTGGAVLLGEAAGPANSAIAALAERVNREGAVMDASSGYVAVPLYVRGVSMGMIAAQFPAAERARLSQHADSLAAVATLGAMALETVREIERLSAENALLL